MTFGFEFYDQDQRLLFNHMLLPYVFLGSRDIGAQIGAQITSDARNRDGLAPDIPTAIELCSVPCPPDTTHVAITGAKLPAEINAAYNNNTGNWQCSFVGLRNQSGKLYFFGRHSGVSTKKSGYEFYDENEKVIFDIGSRPLVPITSADGNIAIPSGKQYAVLMKAYGIGSGGAFIAGSSQGNRQYIRFSEHTGYTDGATAGTQSFIRDVFQGSGTENEDPVTFRFPKKTIIDVTGY